MNEIGKTLSKFLFYAVAAVLLLWTATLTVTFVASALPGMPWYVPYLALVVFDGGMIAWLFVFLKYAQGTIQRATALGLTVFDFLGVGLLVIAEILLGGQTLTEAPEALGTWAIWGIGVWTVVNVLGVLLFHIGDPDAQVQMSIQNEKDAIFRGALANLGARRVQHSKQLAEQIGHRMYDTMLAELFVDRDADGIPDAMQRMRRNTPHSSSYLPTRNTPPSYSYPTAQQSGERQPGERSPAPFRAGENGNRPPHPMGPTSNMYRPE